MILAKACLVMANEAAGSETAMWFILGIACRRATDCHHIVDVSTRTLFKEGAIG